MSVNVEKIQNRITEIKAELAATVAPTPAEAAAAKTAFDDLLAGKIGREEFEKISDALCYRGIEIELENLEETIAKKDMLCYCPKKFVITDTELLSPAGFSPSDRVFFAGSFMVHCDKIPNPSPVTGRAYNIDSFVEKAHS